MKINENKKQRFQSVRNKKAKAKERGIGEIETSEERIQKGLKEMIQGEKQNKWGGREGESLEIAQMGVVESETKIACSSSIGLANRKMLLNNNQSRSSVLNECKTCMITEGERRRDQSPSKCGEH